MDHALLVGREERELLRVTLACGRTFTGRCTIIARQLRPDPKNLLGIVEGPLEEMDLLAVPAHPSIRRKGSNSWRTVSRLWL